MGERMGFSPSGFKWTDAAIDELRRLAAPEMKLSAADIAARLTVWSERWRISRNSVIGKLRRFGIPLASTVNARQPSKRHRNPRAAPKPPVIFRPILQSNSRPIMQPQPICEPVEPIEFKPRRLVIMQLRDNMCRWIIGDHLEPSHRYCGVKTSPGSSWCSHHRALVFGRGTVSERAAGSVPKGVE